MRLATVGKMAVLCGVLAPPAARAVAAQVDMFMTIDGPGFKGAGEQIRVANVTHSAMAPREAATGMASGRRMHSPIVITKEVDQASPKLMQIMQRNEVLPQVTIAFAGSGSGAGAGKAKAAEKIVLKDVTVSSFRQNGRAETFTLNYQQIEVTWTDGGKTATDDWESPR